MKGKWQRKIPSKTGMYWTASRDGQSRNVQAVIYDSNGALYWAGGRVDTSMETCWRGWWWSVPLEPPRGPNEPY